MPRQILLSQRRALVSVQAAAGAVGAAVLGSAAAIEMARAWTAPHVLSPAAEVVGGVMVALFVIAAVGLGVRVRGTAGLAVASAFALLAHGATLVLLGQTVGGLFVGLAPMIGVLAHVAFLPMPVAPQPPSSARIDIAWAIAKCRQRTADTAERAASRSQLAMHA